MNEHNVQALVIDARDPASVIADLQARLANGAKAILIVSVDAEHMNARWDLYGETTTSMLYLVLAQVQRWVMNIK